MLGLDTIRNTRVDREAFEEGEQQGRLTAKLETIPRLLNMGLSVEQIAAALDLDIEDVRQAISPQL